MSEKLEIHVIGTEDTVIGFGLIGISGTIINSAEEAEKLLEELAQSKEYKIIIINRKFLEGIEEYIKNYRLDPYNPILLDIPDESGKIVFESVKDLIRKSIGI
ncbi:MAG: V-type ATP synthase subunit F [Candidatus Helarchaeota archaeon]